MDAPSDSDRQSPTPVLDELPLGTIAWDDAGGISRMNAAAEDILGPGVGESSEEAWTAFVPESDREGFADMFSAAAADAGGYRGVATIRRADGDRIVTEWDNQPVTGDTDVAVVSQFRDVTDHHRPDRSGASVAEASDTIFENVADGVFLVAVDHTGSDRSFHFERANPAHETVSGVATEAIRGLTPVEAFGEAEGQTIRANYNRCVETSETITYEVNSPLPERSAVWEIKLTPVLADGRVDRIVGVARDVTERVERERELERQTARLEEFAGIVSHDLRNPLRVAKTLTNRLGEEIESGHLDDLDAALDRIEALIDDLLRLARAGQTIDSREPVSLAAVVEDAWATVRTADASLAITGDPTLAADRSRLRELLENLLNNAVEHGGADVAIRVGATDGGFFVADDGPGIAPDELESTLEVGYSTTDDGHGFGLSIVAQIADAHGWDIRLSEAESGGARFEFVDCDGSG